MSDQDRTPFDNTPAGRLESIVGFDAAKPFRLGSEAFAEVLKELTKERADVAKGKAKELLSKALSLRESAAKAEREFLAAKKKFDKELGKLVAGIQSIVDGKPVPNDGDQTESEAGS